MSLVLAGSKPKGLEIKTGFLAGEYVHLGDYEISMEDFCQAVRYVLTNTNIKPTDRRVELVRDIKNCKKVLGWNDEGKRFEFQDSTKRKKRG